jgi:fructose-bisphosphate aldolase class I
MNNNKLNQIAQKLSAQPKGILAADESTNTIKKRFYTINLESNFENRRKYRELLFKTANLNKFISGIILFDETLKQSTSEGVPFGSYLTNIGILPGIKVDTGAVPLTTDSSEKFTEGLDGLSKRLDTYKELGAVFTKWRAIISIDEKSKIPSDYIIELNAYTLARYAKVVQENGLVPIVEPEVLMDGEHSIEKCFQVTSKTLECLFEKLAVHSVRLDGILLKPNMIISGKKSKSQASISEVASMTVECLKENVPPEVPGIVFLSGGQSDKIATEHLNEMNKSFKNLPWNLSFSYGRALQQPTLLSWGGKENKVLDSQNALFNRSKLNSIATLGEYSNELENPSA